MADRIAILDKGQVMQVSNPAEIYEAPQSRFVAGFVGTVNMFEGKVASRDGAATTIAGENGMTIVAENAEGVAPGIPVAFAIRPEKIKVSSRRPPQAGETGANVAAGEIFDIAYLGDMTVYHVRLDDGQIVRASSLNASRITEDPLTWHDRAWISFRPDAGIVLTK